MSSEIGLRLFDENSKIIADYKTRLARVSHIIDFTIPGGSTNNWDYHTTIAVENIINDGTWWASSSISISLIIHTGYIELWADREVSARVETILVGRY